MDLQLSERQKDFHAEAARWLSKNVPSQPLPSGDSREGFAAHVEWEKVLFTARWAVVSWPAVYGGRGADLVEWLLFEDAYAAAGAPQRVSQNGIFLLAPTLFEHGTQAQRDRVLPRRAAALDLWCQGWSEPGAGSDLAALTCRALPVEGGYRLHGQKTWCTRGAFCDRLFGLFRTEPQPGRHRGLTYLMVDLRTEGITVRPVQRLDGDEGFAEVFFDGAFVPDDDVIGEPNEGWAVAMSTTGSERGLTLRSPGRFRAAAQRLLELYRRHPNPSLRQDVVRAYCDAEAYHLYTLQTVSTLLAGGKVGAESSANKLFWSELDVRLQETALALLGGRAELVSGASLAVDEGAWMKGYQFALAGPIYAGTNEIQRNLVAERVLGLPRK